MNAEVKKAAGPIAEDARGRAEQWGAPTASGIAAGARAGAAVIRQRRGKTTGRRPDFGALQMREAMIPAVHAGEDGLRHAVAVMLTRLTQ